MVKVLQGCDLADVPVLVLSIDPCISCTGVDMAYFTM